MRALAYDGINLAPLPAPSGPTCAEVFGGRIYRTRQPITSTAQAAPSSRSWADHHEDAT